MNQNSNNHLWKSFASGERRSHSIDEHTLEMLAEFPKGGSNGMCNDEDGVIKAESLDTVACDGGPSKKRSTLTADILVCRCFSLVLSGAEIVCQRLTSEVLPPGDDRNELELTFDSDSSLFRRFFSFDSAYISRRVKNVLLSMYSLPFVYYDYPSTARSSFLATAMTSRFFTPLSKRSISSLGDGNQPR